MIHRNDYKSQTFQFLRRGKGFISAYMFLYQERSRLGFTVRVGVADESTEMPVIYVHYTQSKKENERRRKSHIESVK